MPRLTFDMTLSATVSLDAPDEATAREWINEAMECADTNFGAWPDGSPILGECSLTANMPVDLVVWDEEDDAPVRIKLRGYPHNPVSASCLCRAAFQEDDGEAD